MSNKEKLDTIENIKKTLKELCLDFGYTVRAITMDHSRSSTVVSLILCDKLGKERLLRLGEKSPYLILSEFINKTQEKNRNRLEHLLRVNLERERLLTLFCKSAPSIPNEIPPPPTEGTTVDHPSHYGGEDNPYEAIKVIEAWELGFCLGNTIKYIARAGKKKNNEAILDLEKARWYLDRVIKKIKGEE